MSARTEKFRLGLRGGSWHAHLEVVSSRALVLIAASTVGVAACGTVLSLEDYEVVAQPADSSVADTGVPETSQADACWRADGFGGGQPCFACEASTSLELINACTSASCARFDDRARVAGFDGAVPPPPDGSIDDTAVVDGAVAVDPSLRPCSSLLNPVYVIGSSALELAHRKIGAALLKSGRATLVYRREPSCDGLNAILTNQPIHGVGFYYGADHLKDPEKCRFADAGEVAHLGLCDVFAERCIPGFTGLPPDVEDSLGPIQVFMFATPKTSPEEVISRNGAYTVFGFASGVQPWVDPLRILRRHSASGTQQFLAAAIGLPVDVWRGVRIQGSGEMFNRLRDLPSDAIGITSADVTDDPAKRPEIRTLAYQHTGQSCGFLPDTTRSSWDKRNVRDGHYYLWSPLHMFARVASGTIKHGPTRELVNVLRGVTILPEFDLIATLKFSGLVPRCAMAVARAGESGDLRPSQAELPCDCAFEAATPGATSCASCAVDDACPAARPKCRFGYCEPR